MFAVTRGAESRGGDAPATAAGGHARAGVSCASRVRVVSARGESVPVPRISALRPYEAKEKMWMFLACRDFIPHAKTAAPFKEIVYYRIISTAVSVSVCWCECLLLMLLFWLPDQA